SGPPAYQARTTRSCARNGRPRAARPMPETLFCFGYGYTAATLSSHLMERGWAVRGTSRDPARLAAMQDAGVAGFRFDGNHPIEDAGSALAGVTAVLTSIMPGEGGDPVLEQHAAVLAALPDLRWVGYLGTTAVYGDRGGGWVDES